MTDAVDHPQHYSRWPMEAIEFIAANDLPWWLANVLKYCIRHEHKDGLQDLYKARSYLEMKIRQLEGIVRFWEKPVAEQRTAALIDGPCARTQRGLPEHPRPPLVQPEWLKQTQAYTLVGGSPEAKAWHERITATVPQTFCRCGVNVTSKGFACWDDDCVHKQQNKYGRAYACA